MDWEAIQLNRRDLYDNRLAVHHIEEEVTAVIQDIEPDKAPGPDGFIGIFYKASWGIIKADVQTAINYFDTNHDQHYNLINNAHIVLLPKKEDAKSVGDYRPISLLHNITKDHFKINGN